MSAPVKDVLPVDLEEVGAEHPDIVQTFRPSTLTKFELRRLTHTYVLMQNGVNAPITGTLIYQKAGIATMGSNIQAANCPMLWAVAPWLNPKLRAYTSCFSSGTCPPYTSGQPRHATEHSILVNIDSRPRHFY